jgi:hypothetical protein
MMIFEKLQQLLAHQIPATHIRRISAVDGQKIEITFKSGRCMSNKRYD